MLPRSNHFSDIPLQPVPMQSPDNKNGMVLKKDEVSSGEQGRKNALNGVWIAGGVLVLFVVLLLVLRKKRKDN